MTHTTDAKKEYWQFLNVAAGVAALLIAMELSNSHRFLAGLIVLAVAAAGYFLTVLFLYDRNWLDLRAVFAAVWLFSIGIGQLRLLSYQPLWQRKTWYCLALAYAAFELGVPVGMRIMEAREKKCGRKTGKRIVELHEERLFYICLFVTLIGFTCFLITYRMVGFLPLFPPEGSDYSYVDFYTRFHVFSVASTVISGLCYYTLRTQKLNGLKKAALLLCIVYETFVFPLLTVSRGTFLISSVPLTVTIFFLEKKRLRILALCLVVMVGFYLQISTGRGYSDDELETLFEPTVVETDAVSVKLSPKESFIYCYFTVSHDNFDEAVRNVTEYSHGLRELKPFAVVIRIRALREKMDSFSHYLIREHLNTINIVGDAYYDFGIIGVGIMPFLWAVAFGMIQKRYLLHATPFSLITLGVTTTPAALSFFSPWMSDFTQWMFWGTILLCYIAAIWPKRKKT